MVDQISTQNPANNSSKSLKGEQVLPSEILEILRNNLIFYARSLEKNEVTFNPTSCAFAQSGILGNSLLSTTILYLSS